jgi:FtsP/CotA-like multicopper oxidase with cupredoxin domain
MSTNATIQVQPTDNTLINGKMPFNCSQAAPGSVCSPDAGFSKFRVQNGKTYKLRIINSGAGSILDFSIDNHHLTIIANDFVDLQPYNTTIVTLGVSLFQFPHFSGIC